MPGGQSDKIKKVEQPDKTRESEQSDKGKDAEQSHRVKEAVRAWFSREGVKVEAISDPRAEFLFKVKFMRFFFTIVRPNDQKFIQIEAQVMISPEHLKLLTAEKMRVFQMQAMKSSFAQNVNLGFVQPQPGQPGPQPPGPGFVASDRIYDDAFSEDRLWYVIRRVHSAVDMVILILNEVTGQIGEKPHEGQETGPSYYT
jgi:hypothetical protein